MQVSNGLVAVQVLGWRGKIVGLLLAWLALGGGTAMATNYVWKAGLDGNWTATGASSIWQGDPAAYPAFGDTVRIATLTNQPHHYPALSAGAGWGASTITLISTNTALWHRYLNFNAAGYVDTLIVSNTIADGSGGFSAGGAGVVLTLREYSDVGPIHISYRANPNDSLVFTNSAVITYGVTVTNTLASGYNFNGATSVELRKNTATAAVQCEVIQNVYNGNSAVTYYFGRPDNNDQNWTVTTGSHPLIVAQQKGGMRVAGTGNVTMPDVDLEFWLNQSMHAGLLSGTHWNALNSTPAYVGTVSAHSLKIDGTAIDAARSFVLGGRLLLGGQGGLQAGGAGNGHAVYVNVGNNANNLTFRLTTVDPNAGKLEISPAGGDVYLTSTGAGKAILNINVKNADATNKATIIANTINLAATNALISDINLNGVANTKGGTIEFRGDFISQSIDTNAFRLDRSTLRTIAGTTNAVQYWECMSQDNGATVDPSTNNFALGMLVLGQNSTGLTMKADLVLRDQSDNNRVDAGAEAVYVTNLTMYASSVLYLNGFNLYHKNSGTWQKASPGLFPDGDGTGRIGSSWPAMDKGTVISVR